MYKKDNNIMLIISILLALLSYKLNIHIDKTMVSDFITFISIYMGFIITSFSIMSTNEEIKKLHAIKDAENQSLSCLGRLANYYKTNFLISLFTLCLLLISEMFNLLAYVSIFILSLTFMIIYSSLMLLKILLDIFVNKVIFTK